MPCGDKDDCNEKNHTEQTAQNEHHDHDDEVCTPFCVCSCCATHVLFTNFSSDFSIHKELATVYTKPANADICSAVISIWQPPKLSC